MSDDNTRDQDISVYDDDIDYYIQEYCQKYGFNEFKLSSREWSGCLRYINMHVFKNNPDILMQKSVNGNSEYNLDIVNKLIDRYIYICDIHSKEINVYGFSTMSGISESIMSSWYTGRYRTYDYIDNNGNIIPPWRVASMSPGQYHKRATHKAKNIMIKLYEHNRSSIYNGVDTRHGVAGLARFNYWVEKQKTAPARDSDRVYADIGVLERLGIESGGGLIEDKN